jgi:hypothetical protein
LFWSLLFALEVVPLFCAGGGALMTDIFALFEASAIEARWFVEFGLSARLPVSSAPPSKH